MGWGWGGEARSSLVSQEAKGALKPEARFPHIVHAHCSHSYLHNIGLDVNSVGFPCGFPPPAIERLVPGVVG